MSDITLDKSGEKKLLEILEYFKKRYKKDNYFNYSDSVSLMSGISGTILLQTLLYDTFKEKELKREIENNIDHVITLLEEQNNVLFSFCGGLAGVGWLFLYLNKKQVIDIEIDNFLQEIDDTLKVVLEEWLNSKLLDYLHGALGIGIYFLKRNKFTEVKKIIASLYNFAYKEKNELKWAFSLFSEELFFDCGMAHGNCSILAFLLKCYKRKILPNTCYEMIESLMNFYVNNIQDFDKIGSYFPYKISTQDYLSNKKNEVLSRIAWCYGDLSILYTLYLSSFVTKNNNLKNDILRMLINTSKRKEHSSTFVDDACFCHGTSGIAYIYYRLFKHTQNDIFKESSIYWTNQTILMGNNNNSGVNGYLFGFENIGNVPSLDILNGYAGIGLLLITIYGKTDCDWDEIFLLS